MTGKGKQRGVRHPNHYPRMMIPPRHILLATLIGALDENGNREAQTNEEDTMIQKNGVVGEINLGAKAEIGAGSQGRGDQLHLL